MTGLTVQTVENQGSSEAIAPVGDNVVHADSDLGLTGQPSSGTAGLDKILNDTTGGDPFNEAAELKFREEQEAEYRDNLFRELGRTANRDRPMPAITIYGILKHLRMWELSFERVDHQPVHRFRRLIIDPAVLLLLPEPTQRRSFQRDEGSITIQVEDEDLWGRDFRDLLAIEDQYPEDLRRREAETIIKNDSSSFQWSEASVEFHESQGTYLHEDDLFTDTESVILSNMLQFGTLGKLAEHLKTSTAELAKILNPLCERVGITSNKTWQRPDPYVELMLIAIALDKINIESLDQDKAVELIDGLTEVHKEILALYHSPDLKRRQDIRNRLSRNIFSTRWTKVYRDLGLNLGMGNRHMAVLYAVRAEALRLPDPDVIRKLLARTPDQAK